ncbi:rhodanese-like domain-containing protein [Tepidibacillus marianensis]|uniref:rhodanese-like domain-containing protein n=1 Tax=Tepidibacillus marianensis TaxID=3131995 RepID=UPI0030D02D3B
MIRHHQNGIFLVDARPAKMYAEGHVNGAINIPDAEFDKFSKALPAKKDTLIIFYCGGLECSFSSNAIYIGADGSYTF